MPLTGWLHTRASHGGEDSDRRRCFDDGEALWEFVCERRVEEVVAKRDRDHYRPGERAWIKHKTPAGRAPGQDEKLP